MIGRRLALGLVVLAAATVLLVVLDVGGPLRSAVALLFLLAGPGLALSLPMSPMSVEARVLVAIAGSAACVSLVSLVLMFAGAWSGELGVVLLAAGVLLLAGSELRNDRRGDVLAGARDRSNGGGSRDLSLAGDRSNGGGSRDLPPADDRARSNGGGSRDLPPADDRDPPGSPRRASGHERLPAIGCTDPSDPPTAGPHPPPPDPARRVS